MHGLAWEAINTAVSAGESKRERIAALLETTERLAARLDTPYARASAYLAQAGCSLCMGDPRQVEMLAQKAEQLFRDECRGTSWEATFARSWRYGGIELAGDLSQVLREAPEAERDAREKDDGFALGALTLVVPMAHLMTDDVGAALDHLERQAERLTDDFDAFHLWVMNRMTDAHLYSGRPSAAFEYLESRWPAFQASFLSRARLFRVNGQFLHGRVAIAAARETGDATLVKRARRAAQGLRAYARPDAAAYAHLIDAAVARVSGDVDQARARLQHTVATCEAAGMRNFALYARRNLAALGGYEGAESLASVDAALSAMGIRRPERWTRTYAPGFDG
jgi:eukaryotic-like serine/threonine-protein kinase